MQMTFSEILNRIKIDDYSIIKFDLIAFEAKY